MSPEESILIKISLTLNTRTFLIGEKVNSVVQPKVAESVVSFTFLG